MSKTAWIVATLVLVAGFTTLVMAYGALGVIAAILGTIGFFIGLDQFYRWRSRRLAQSMAPGETLLAAGLVSEDTFEETAAVLVRITGTSYRLLIADKRGTALVESVTPTLRSHPSVYDGKSYIELGTPNGSMHFAPRRGLLIGGQSQYAQQVLDTILAAPPVPRSPHGA